MLSAHLNFNDKIIDIGCDHALLDIYLGLKYPSMRIVASDIEVGPLNIAKNNIIKYHLENQITLRLGNGLEALDDSIDTIVISGMGTRTILNILDDIDNYPSIKKIILSPNNDFELLRKNICQLNLKIISEEMVCEKGKYYLIIELNKGYEEVDNFFGKLNLNNQIVKNYYTSLYEKNTIILRNKLTDAVRKKLLIENEKIKDKIIY